MQHKAWLDIAARVLAIVLMLGGVVLIFTDTSTGLAFALIAVGTALVLVVQRMHQPPTTTH